MKGLLRRLRGIIGTGLTWAVGFAFLGTVPGVFQGEWDVLLSVIPGNASVGFIFGSVFAVVLSIVERRRRLEDLSIPRIGLWGAFTALLIVGGMQFFSAGTLYWEPVLILSLYSGALSSGSLALARRAEPKLIESQANSTNGNPMSCPPETRPSRVFSSGL
jgi:hypothetical protein